mmetsp:Transcript_15990/g.37026  ORF Transcript_15990/g.37026 Transcript_15990/m.37026 type:complete len:435 (+) Transcript_15990:44-1348(+)
MHGRSSHKAFSSLALFVVCLLFLQLASYSFSSPPPFAVKTKIGGDKRFLPFRRRKNRPRAELTECAFSPLETEEATATTESIDENGDAPRSVAAASTEDLPFFARWPKWLQHSIRDRGGVRFIVDSATRGIAAPIFYRENPWCFPEFVRISGREYPWLVRAFRRAGLIADTRPDVRFEKVRYGDHPQQVAQVMISEDAAEAETNGTEVPLFLFLHGGAWGSGFPTMYRLLSLPFLDRNFRSVILGYRTYPAATIEGQVDDLVRAVQRFTADYGRNAPVVLMGHSSGAHVCLLAALQGRLPSVDALVGASGVYDIERQHRRDRALGLGELSPMVPANGFTPRSFRKHSPAASVATNEPLPEGFPPNLLLVHGDADDVVLPESSVEFADRLGRDRCRLEIVEGAGHEEIVSETLLGGTTQSVICGWIDSVLGRPGS